MIRVTAKQLAERIATRPPEYSAELEPAILRRLENGDVEFDPTHPAWIAAVAKYLPVKNSISREWPLWARAIREFRGAGDVGVGDTVHRELGAAGEAFKLTMKTLGAPCGCNARRAEWNALYPYEKAQCSSLTSL